MYLIGGHSVRTSWEDIVCASPEDVVITSTSLEDVITSISVEDLVIVHHWISVQFSSVQDGIYELGKAYMRSTPSLRSFPIVALETVPMLV